MGGYQRTSLVLNRTFNLLLSSTLIILSSPLMLLVLLLVLLRNGRPAIYRGTRLGIDKKPFTMYKFRTLVRDANRILGAQVLTARHKLTAPMGKFLRDTRLDELPQLFNVLMGHMDFVGPRPVRPEMYENICRHIPNYDRRFEIKPGLIGMAQLYTPHNAPKKIRTLIDNTLIKKKQKLLWDVWAVAFAGGVVLKVTLSQSFKYLYRDFLMTRILRKYSEKRELERRNPDRALVFPVFTDGREAPAAGCELVDINEDAFLMRSWEKIENPFPAAFRLEVRLKRGGLRKAKIASCEGELYREIESPGKSHGYVVKYKPISPLNYYIIHQYFLAESLV